MWLKYMPRTAPSEKAKLASNLEPHLNSSLLRDGWIEVAHVCKSHFDAIKSQPGAMLTRPALPAPWT